MKKEELVERIRNGDGEAYEELFFEYYSKLCGFAFRILKSDELAKDCVQEVFLKIWRNRKDWVINYSLRVYLYKSVRNQALNKIEKQKTRRDYTRQYYEEGIRDIIAERPSRNRDRELVDQIWQLAESLPKRRRTVFELHKKNGLSYKEIAKIMGITRKTVENHMGRALQEIRNKLNPQKIKSL